MTKSQVRKLKKRFAGKAKFRVAPGSDNPASDKIPRVIVTFSQRDNETYKEIHSMAEDIIDMFEVEDLVFG